VCAQENRADLFPPKKPVPAINVAQAAVSLLVDTPETFEYVNFAGMHEMA
jgi:hypothetical protein